MNASIVGLVVFGFGMAGALFGLSLARRMPQHVLDSQSRDSIKLAVGLIATMTALVLGLVTASAKSTFDSLSAAVRTSAVEVLALDRTLARYGPETAEIRADLKHAVELRVELTWPSDSSRTAELHVLQQATSVEAVGNRILLLVPSDDLQRALKARAVALAEKLLEARWLLHAGSSASVPLPFLAVLTLWITITFAIFGMLAPSNRIVIGVLAACAMSVGTALFIILEMDGPFDGVLTVSGKPLRQAVLELDR
jgi:hypothetical protein